MPYPYIIHQANDYNLRKQISDALNELTVLGVPGPAGPTGPQGPPGPPGPAGTGGREVLTESRDYFVSPFGSDGNTGLSNTPDLAWLTVQHAVDVIYDTLDFAGNTVTIFLVDNAPTPVTLTGAVTLTDRQVGGGYLVIEGMGATPDLVTLYYTTGNTLVAEGNSVNLTLRNLTAMCGGTGGAVVSQEGARVALENVAFGNTASGKHIVAIWDGLVEIFGTYNIVANAQNHMYANWGGKITFPSSAAAVLVGSRAFAAGFALADNLGLISVPVATYTGTATGNKFSVKGNAMIGVGGRGINVFPGSNPGTWSQGGQYDTLAHGFEEVFSLEVPTVANQDYNIRYDAPFNGSITKVRTKSQSGTCTVTGKINVTALGGTANSASSSATEQVHSTANTFVKGDILRFTASANSACLGLAVSFYINRTS